LCEALEDRRLLSLTFANPQTEQSPDTLHYDFAVQPRTAAAGGPAVGVDFGDQDLLGSIEGFKWNDLDGDGRWDQPAEPALPGVTVYLDSNENGQLDEGEPETETDLNGEYSFTGLAPGRYVVAEVLPLGWDQTFPAVGEGFAPGRVGDAAELPELQTFTWAEQRPAASPP